MTWLVTGGAGYIGSHVVRGLNSCGLEAVVLDNFSTGHRAFVPAGVPFVEASLLDRKSVESALSRFRVHGIIHAAGYKYASESVRKPLIAYEQNVTGTALLFQAAITSKVRNIVFSSSAAVYGTPNSDVVTESTETHPESPYGRSKLFGEWMLEDVARAEGIRHTSLRYFNVVGSGDQQLFDSSPYNLFPLTFRSLRNGRTPKIFGRDYPTPDGTNIRDYVHVSDIAAAHVTAACRLEASQRIEPAYNLGSGSGHSVLDIMSTIARITGIDIEPIYAPRREGDPPKIVADGALAAKDLGWVMRYSLDEMVRSAWEAFPG